MQETKKKVLIVDDDKQILSTLTQILEKAGYTVETAETAAEANKKLEQNQYSVALIDIRLPDAEGTDLLLKIPKTSNTARIIITGYSTVEYGEKSAEYGADDFLVKPVKAKELLDSVKTWTSEE
jgi:two-component system NtrC family response regulator